MTRLGYRWSQGMWMIEKSMLYDILLLSLLYIEVRIIYTAPNVVQVSISTRGPHISWPYVEIVLLFMHWSRGL